MPRHRVNNRFCKSNRYNVKLRSYTIWQIFEMIDEVEPNPGVPNGHKKLVDLLCPDDGNQAARYYKWNFTPILREDAAKRTIEFRQPPGSLNLDDTVFWCQFVHTFTWAAMFPSYWRQFPDSEASLDELRQMLKEAGAEKRTLCEYEERLFEQAFKDKSLLPDDTYEETPFTSEDLAKIRRKHRVEELKMQRAEASMAESTSNDELPFPVVFSDDEDE